MKKQIDSRSKKYNLPVQYNFISNSQFSTSNSLNAGPITTVVVAGTSVTAGVLFSWIYTSITISIFLFLGFSGFIDLTPDLQEGLAARQFTASFNITNWTREFIQASRANGAVRNDYMHIMWGLQGLIHNVVEGHHEAFLQMCAEIDARHIPNSIIELGGVEWGAYFDIREAGQLMNENLSTIEAYLNIPQSNFNWNNSIVERIAEPASSPEPD